MGEGERQDRIEITHQDFDTNSIIESMRTTGVGAVVTFIGTVRDFAEVGNEGSKENIEVKQLSYECYKDMALKKMEEIKNRVIAEYDINDMCMVHRTGVLKPGERIVLIAVSAPHRKDAFAACEYAIEELKKSVPIWKKEMTKEAEYWVVSGQG